MATKGLYPPGARISARYEIERFIGAGGFAAVYAATDLDIERPVAIKVLNIAALAIEPKAQEVFIQRFRREARVAARKKEEKEKHARRTEEADKREEQAHKAALGQLRHEARLVRVYEIKWKESEMRRLEQSLTQVRRR